MQQETPSSALNRKTVGRWGLHPGPRWKAYAAPQTRSCREKGRLLFLNTSPHCWTFTPDSAAFRTLLQLLHDRILRTPLLDAVRHTSSYYSPAVQGDVQLWTKPLILRNIYSDLNKLEVCGYTNTRRFTRTRGSGMGRVDILRVRIGSGKKITGMPVFYP